MGVPFEMGLVAFYYNKKLFEKAGVKAEDIKSWDDFLGAVKKLKAAGVTPIVVGAGDKWPMHFYYSYLVMRIGGEHALADAKAGKDGGFKSATFVEAGKRLRELGALEPFQPGFLATKHGESSGMFGDGKAAMDLMGQWLLGMQAPNSATGKGLPEEDIGILTFPVVAGRQGQGDRHARGDQRLARVQDRAARGRRFPQVLQSGEIRPRGGCDGRLHSRRQGSAVRNYESAVPSSRRRTCRDDLPSELLRSGPRPIGRARDQ